MRTGIICYSFTQNNLILAADLQARTGGTFIPIEEKSSRSRFTIFMDIFFHRVPRIREYLHLDERFDHCILISPVWGGKIASPLRAFLLMEGSKIKSYSFISLCGGGKRQLPEIEKELTGLLGRKPVVVSQLALTELAKTHPADLMNYRVNAEDLKFFEDNIDDFLLTIAKSVTPVVSV